jgi:hypothetical protein
VFTPVVLSLDGLRVTQSTPQEVCSIAHDHHFGVEVQEQAARQHKTPEVWGVDEGIFHGDGLYHMGMNCNPLFVLRSCHAESKWCRRRLAFNEQLQLYDVSDSVLKCLDEEARVALVNVQGLTPLKMLYRGVEVLFSVLRGGGWYIYDWVMQNTLPSDLAKYKLAPCSSSTYSWLSNEPLCIKI